MYLSTRHHALKHQHIHMCFDCCRNQRDAGMAIIGSCYTAWLRKFHKQGMTLLHGLQSARTKHSEQSMWLHREIGDTEMKLL